MLALILTAVVLAQVTDTPNSGWTLDGVAKVGLGVASFFALIGGGGFVLRFLLTELKDSRKAFIDEGVTARKDYLAALEKQHAAFTKELEDLRMFWEVRDEKLRERVHNLSAVMQGAAFDRERSRG